MQAVWRGTVITQSDDNVVVEGNHYFPRVAVDERFVIPSSSHTTTCAWKGRASYLTLRVGDEESRDAAWYYPDPSPAAERIRDRVAFWPGVEVRDENAPDGGSVVARLAGRLLG